MELKSKHHLTNYQLPFTNFQIKEMEVHHLHSILEIERTSFHSPWPAHVFLEDIKSENAITVVALGGQTLMSVACVVGYAVAWIAHTELHIGNIAVKKGFRRQGTGERLLQELLQRGTMKGIQLATLEVRVSNKPAIRLYQKFGFQEIAIQKGYYKLEGEDALVMINYNLQAPTLKRVQGK